MHVEILHLVPGARAAAGIAVIIDVFRAFTGRRSATSNFVSLDRFEFVLPAERVEREVCRLRKVAA